MTDPSPQDDPLWYKDAIIYEVPIKSFFDSDDDGIGDLVGLTEKLDYLQELGVTAIWLLPFYPSPLRDDGYDIADYKGVNPAYGNLADFRHFVHAAHKRTLRVITELVINHTSDQHPWFQRARLAKSGSSHRDFYVWSDSDERYQDTRVIFCDTETSNWTWDPIAKAYFWHRFYSHQPDLNFDNPAVVRVVLNAMRFWLDLGVDGLRLDAVPYLCEREGTSNENLPETHAILKILRAEIDASYPDKMLLAEANQWPEDVLPYFGNGDECHMAFHFPLMPRIYMAVAQEDRHPITDIMRQTPDIPESCQWAIFLRNHDELTLEMVTDRERDYLWDFYADNQRMRLNMGIRRRLAPLMDDDRGRIGILNSILLSMPGTPVLYYGDEIGMGDNVYLGDRDGVRTPMQWSPDRNGGFSRADPAQLFLPAIQDPIYGFSSVNVEAQNRSPTSMLNSMRRLIAVRRDVKSMGRGKLTFLYPHNRQILTYVRTYQGEVILCVVNLARSAQSVELDLSAFRGRIPVELLGLSHFPAIGDRPYHLTMAGHGFFWFSLLEPDQIAGGLTIAEPDQGLDSERATLVLRKGWNNLLTGPVATEFYQTVLPERLPTRRWFAAKDGKIAAIRMIDAVELPGLTGYDSWCLDLIEASLVDGRLQRYQLALGLLWGPPTSDARIAARSATIAGVRRLRVEGALIDAGSDASFALAIIAGIAASQTIASHGGGAAQFRPTTKFALHSLPKDPAPRPLGGEQSNSSIAIEDYAVLKLYRRLQTGIHPEIEIGRFLTERTDFSGSPALLGTVEYIDPTGEVTALAVLSRYVHSQGDGWAYVQSYLKRFFQSQRPGAGHQERVEAVELDPHATFIELADRLGRQTAALHRALCPSDGADPAFTPEPIVADDIASWQSTVRRTTENLLGRLEAMLPTLTDPNVENAVRTLVDLRGALMTRIDAVALARIDAVKTRYHGDFHLGQILVAQRDFMIIDFEGEPSRPINERRQKHSPLKDVAGMVRSLNYAAATAVRSVADLPAVDLIALETVSRDWCRRSVAAFLAGYRAGIDGATCWPADPDGARALLDLLLIEKALYEIDYELANRPTWLGIPVQGIIDLLTLPQDEVPDGKSV
ncbi:MAG: maltose alpha-D-glucosyltransferase [Azospirillaceae bacterium]|nr:maltose alpha-D-glucosyltransferase [Azospirillaceae bacterium]